MKRAFFILLAACMGFVGGGEDRLAAQNLLVNGGFEAPALNAGSYVTVDPNQEPPAFGWIVASGNVDVARLPLFPFIQYPAYEGFQALDLNGTESGAVSQDFATVVGQPYALNLAYSDNPFESGVSSASIVVTDLVTGNRG
jgi:hypothetical protein